MLSFISHQRSTPCRWQKCCSWAVSCYKTRMSSSFLPVTLCQAGALASQAVGQWQGTGRSHEAWSHPCQPAPSHVGTGAWVSLHNLQGFIFLSAFTLWLLFFWISAFFLHVFCSSRRRKLTRCSICHLMLASHSASKHQPPCLQLPTVLYAAGSQHVVSESTSDGNWWKTHLYAQQQPFPVGYFQHWLRKCVCEAP